MTSRINAAQKRGCAWLVGTVVGVILIGAGLIALTSILFMWAWGLFMAPVFDLPLLSFPEAFGGVLLLTIVRSTFLQPRAPKKP